MDHKIKYLALPLSIILLAISACKKDEIGSNSGGIPLLGGDAAVISASDKPLDVMTKAMRAQLDAKSYRSHVTSSSSSGTESKMLLEYVAPDRYRMVRESKVGGKDYDQEYIITGNGTYIKSPNGQWIKSPVDLSDLIKAFRDPKVLDELAKTADVKFIGPDTLDGAPMLVYQYTQNNPLGMDLKSIAKTWVSIADGLPRQTESNGEFAGHKTHTLITVSDYNSDIKIESPAK